MAKQHRVLYLVIALIMLFSSSTIVLGKVSDIDTHWAKNEITYLMDRNVMEGYADGTFRPDNSITRAEFIKMVNNVHGFVEMTDVQFIDIDKKDWFYKDIRRAMAAGYIEGYGDATIRPNTAITRQEAAKILAVASQLEGKEYDNLLKFKDVDKIDTWAIDYVNIIVNHGYIVGYKDGTFAPKKAISRAETAKILSLVHKDLMKEEENPGEEAEKPKPTPKEQFENLIDQLPDPMDITKIIAEEKAKVEQARNIYNNLKPEEKDSIPRGKIEKLIDVERKIESLKTRLMTDSKAEIRQAQAWAIKRGAHKRFVDVAEYYWAYGELTGINPEILYAQAAKETAYGRYTGSVKPEMNNWAGIKVYDPKGDNTYDHEVFETPEDGVRGHFNHVGIYCGVDPIGTPHPRWYKTSTASWAGSVMYVEDLGGKWAPSHDYGISIVRDYLNILYATPIPAEKDMEIALEFSDLVESVDKEDREAVLEILESYVHLTVAQRELIPNNIKEELTNLAE